MSSSSLASPEDGALDSNPKFLSDNDSKKEVQDDYLLVQALTPF